MEKTRFGYCCINLTLQQQKGITIGRGMIKRTFEQKGISYASELALQNVRDLIEIIKWNNQQGIKLYRMSSDMIPWMSEYELKDLPDYTKISNLLKGAGKIAMDAGQRLTFHPGHFCVIASQNPDVVVRSIKELNQHGEIMDLIGLPRTPDAAINIHINTTAISKEDSLNRFIKAFDTLDLSVKERMTVENDDKKAQYSISDLVYGLSAHTGIPIVFDYHHHWCYDDPMPEKDALYLAASTWPEGIRQLVHYSSCKKLHEDSSVVNRAHADHIYEKVNSHGLFIDVDLEAKAKDLALMNYLKKYETILVDQI
jgi:UV DNA damage endonuclease